MNLTDITKQIRAFADQLDAAKPKNPHPEICGRLDCKVAVTHYEATHPQCSACDAPPFQLPPPPPGMQWHRKDGWKAEDLPPGTRPLVAGEQIESQDKCCHVDPGAFWGQCTGFYGKSVMPKTKSDLNGDTVDYYHYRTTRHLVFQHAGKSWIYHRPGDPMPCDGERMVHTFWVSDEQCDTSEIKDSAKEFDWTEVPEVENRIIGWRYAEPRTREVELGPEDVPPFSVIRRKGEDQNWHWRLLSYVHGTHAICANRGYTWSELAREYEINRPRHRDENGNPTLWEKCSKTVTVERP